MQTFLVEVRIYPNEPADGRPPVTGEELISVLANSTASEALADALAATIEFEVLEPPTAVRVDACLAGGVFQDVAVTDAAAHPVGHRLAIHAHDDGPDTDCPVCGTRNLIVEGAGHVRADD
jgi:hypothetical protein